MTTTQERVDKWQHAIDNAEGFVEDLVRLHKAYQEAMLDSDENCEALEEEARAHALSLEVRSDWQSIGDNLEPTRGRLLISTGGPALQVLLDIDDSEGSDPRLQIADWGLNWTDYKPKGGQDAWDALDWFASLFWYGEV